MDIPKEKVLLVGFNPALIASLRGFLQSKYQVETATSAQMAEFLIQEWEPKICMVEDSQELINWVPKVRVQKTSYRMGFIAFASGLHHNEERAFKQGCDHWIHMDSALDKVSWRIQSLLRNQTQNTSSGAAKTVAPLALVEEPTLQIEQLQIYPKDFLVKRQGNVVNISPTQFKLLNAFVSHPDQLLSRDWIKTHVWNDSEISLRSIDAHISKLRKALPELDQYLMNIYGKGYIFSRSKQEAA